MIKLDYPKYKEWIKIQKINRFFLVSAQIKMNMETDGKL